MRLIICISILFLLITSCKSKKKHSNVKKRRQIINPRYSRRSSNTSIPSNTAVKISPYYKKLKPNSSKAEKTLINACFLGKLNIVKYLVEKGVNVNCRNLNSYTPLIAACSGLVKNNYFYYPNQGVITYLINKGAKVNLRNSEGWSALNFAVKNHLISVVKLLVAKGADINSRTNDGRTPLIWAAIERKYELLLLLLKNNANVNIRDKNGWTALVWACSLGYDKIVYYLIKNDADVNVKTKIGQTPLQIAKARGYLKIIKMLKDAGADDED